MFIEDEELRELYKVASADHIAKLEQGLLSLEQQPDNSSILTELLRETHSLKGDSRMLGVAEAEMLVHQMEELLIEVQNQETVLSDGLCDRLYLGIDAVKKIATEAITGEPAGVDTFEVMAQLMGAEEEPLGMEMVNQETDSLAIEDELRLPVVPEFDEVLIDQSSEMATEITEVMAASAYIEDDELRELYKVASTDHLSTIEQGLLTLEQQPDDAETLKELLRATHSLKGDSRMLGVADAETIVHQMEELLTEVQKGEASFSQDLCDRLYFGLDAVRKIATEAVTGDPSGVVAFDIVASLMGAEGVSEPAQPISENSTAQPKAQPQPQAKPQPQAQSQAKPAPATEQIDTVRVGFPKLDALMSQAGELLVTKLRVERRQEDVAQLFGLWEEWNRDFSINRRLFEEIQIKLTPEEKQKITQRNQQERQHLEQFGGLVSKLKSLVLEDSSRLDTVATQLESGIRNLRLLPLSTTFNLFPRMVRDLAKQLGKEIEFSTEGGDISVDKRILEEIKDPLTHIIRNAIDHGIETPEVRAANNKPSKAKLLLKGSQVNGRIVIEIIDDGGGLDTEKIALTALKRSVCTESELTKMTPEQVQSLIFAPGFSTRSEVSAISGRGVGLDVVRENVERLKGSVAVESTFKQGCKFQLEFNASLSTTNILLVTVDRQYYGIPIDYIEKMVMVSTEDIFQIEDSPSINWEDKPISVAWLKDLLSIKKETIDNNLIQKKPCIIIKIGREKIGIFADRLIGQENIILKNKSKILSGLSCINGSAILGDGSICTVLEPRELVRSTMAGVGADSYSEIVNKVVTKPKVLLVEDSIPIRTQVRRILISDGYDVTVAVDGLEGFNTLQEGSHFDAVVSDVEMPNLSGLEMTAKVRQNPKYDELPIILVTTLATDDDRRRGAEAGANAYLTKGDFDQSLLLETLRRLI